MLQKQLKLFLTSRMKPLRIVRFSESQPENATAYFMSLENSIRLLSVK